MFLSLKIVDAGMAPNLILNFLFVLYVIVIRVLVAGLATKNFDDLPLALGFSRWCSSLYFSRGLLTAGHYADTSVMKIPCSSSKYGMYEGEGRVNDINPERIGLISDGCSR
jgi:hypothetical protein